MEKRKYKRIKKYFGINIVSAQTKDKTLRFDSSEASPKFYDESGLDFSPEGVNIMCSKTLPRNSKIEMKILIPDNQELNHIKANGTVEWLKEVDGTTKKYFLMGVKFSDISSADKEKLVELWTKNYGEN